PRIVLTLRPRSPLPPLLADAGQLQQLLTTLCLHVRDAMPAGGRLLLETEVVTVGESEVSGPGERRRGTFVRLRVADTGEGMAPEGKGSRIEPVFPAVPERGGSLRWTLAGDIVAEYGRWIEQVSAPGQGVRFDVYRPAA